MNLRDGTHQNRGIFEMQIERKSGSSRPSQTGESPSQLSQFAGVFRASEISIFYGSLPMKKFRFWEGFTNGSIQFGVLLESFSRHIRVPPVLKGVSLALLCLRDKWEWNQSIPALSKIRIDWFHYRDKLWSFPLRVPRASVIESFD